MKDIFIDNNVAKDFATPVEDNYKKLIKWILTYNKNENDAYLVVSTKLINEYYSSSQNCLKSTAISNIVVKLTREGRINSFKNKDIKDFMKKEFQKKITKKLLSNTEDRWHIPIVLLSERKIALTIDGNFKHDLENFPKYNVIVSDCPSKIDYE